MEKQNIIISTMPVTIKVMEVGGKKMTMSVFKQIPEMHFIRNGTNREQRQASFLGWVKIPNVGYFFVFTVDSVLYKWRWENYKSVIEKIGSIKNNIKNIENTINNRVSQIEDRYNRDIDYIKKNLDNGAINQQLYDRTLLSFNEERLNEIRHFEKNLDSYKEKLKEYIEQKDKYENMELSITYYNNEFSLYLDDDKNQIYISI